MLPCLPQDLEETLALLACLVRQAPAEVVPDLMSFSVDLLSGLKGTWLDVAAGGWEGGGAAAEAGCYVQWTHVPLLSFVLACLPSIFCPLCLPATAGSRHARIVVWLSTPM